MSLTRRDTLAGLATLAALPRSALAETAAAGDAVAFSEEGLHDFARAAQAAEYAPMPLIPQPWRDLGYDDYRQIWFDPRNALWEGTDRPFRVDFFHPGLYFPRPVEISVVADGMARKVPFDLSLFDKTDKFPDLPVDETMGYSGLRLRAELERPGIHTEFAVFQGASYFRAIGTGLFYGLSARGLALRTADAEGEEFPEFTRFWLEAPDPDASTIRMHAFLDSPSVCGVYRFDITPGAETTMDVQATLYPRVALDHVGLAPLTSMFLFDETNRTRFDDWRPAVHDSDGLMVWNGAGEQLWRPLANPRELQVSSFVDDNPRGFGLMQRSRDIAQFADLEAHYHDRPSLWITPGEDWGKGSVTLVEIPSDREIYDNIVAYWRPRDAIAAGGAHSFTYTMTWAAAAPPARPVARVLNTRQGLGFDQQSRVFAIDFAPHEAFEGDLDSITKFVGTNRGAVSEGILQRNPETGGVRFNFSFDPGEAEAAEYRAQLLKDGITITEVWLYRWTA